MMTKLALFGAGGKMGRLLTAALKDCEYDAISYHRDHEVFTKQYGGAPIVIYRGYIGGGKSRYITNSESYPYHPVGNIIRSNILIGDEISFGRGAKAEDNTVTDNTMLPQDDARSNDADWYYIQWTKHIQ
jgi:hypothetical protein